MRPIGMHMEITRQLVLVFTFVMGPMVLASYAYGVSHSEDPTELWGGIPESWQTFIVPFMFLAAIGFIMYWYIVFFYFEEGVMDSLRWPWGDSDGMGASRLLLTFALIMIPSALWLESTIFHMENDYSWTPILVVGTLLLTSIGNVMMGLIAVSAYQDGLDRSSLMIVGSVFMAIQCILNDFVIWAYKFPW